MKRKLSSTPFLAQYKLYPKMQITKIFHFEMAHVLHGHKGLCKNLHGHSYKFHVTLSGQVKNQPGASDDGMIMDFGDLKALVKEFILDVFDHAIVLNENAPQSKEIQLLGYDRVLLVPFQPTAENLILHFSNLLKDTLPVGVKLEKLTLWETESAYVEI